jgi:hypothetical protein
VSAVEVQLELVVAHLPVCTNNSSTAERSTAGDSGAREPSAIGTAKTGARAGGNMGENEAVCLTTEARRSERVGQRPRKGV